MTTALEDLGARLPAPVLTLSQAGALATIHAEARRAQMRVQLPLHLVIVPRPARAHETTMQALANLGLVERREIKTGHRLHVTRWRLTAAGIAVAESPAPAAVAGGRAA
jgi:hypothetical protein